MPENYINIFFHIFSCVVYIFFITRLITTHTMYLVIPLFASAIVLVFSMHLITRKPIISIAAAGYFLAGIYISGVTFAGCHLWTPLFSLAGTCLFLTACATKSTTRLLMVSSMILFILGSYWEVNGVIAAFAATHALYRRKSSYRWHYAVTGMICTVVLLLRVPYWPVSTVAEESSYVTISIAAMPFIALCCLFIYFYLIEYSHNAAAVFISTCLTGLAGYSLIAYFCNLPPAVLPVIFIVLMGAMSGLHLLILRISTRQCIPKNEAFYICLLSAYLMALYVSFV